MVLALQTTEYEAAETFNGEVVAEDHGREEYVHLKSADDEYEHLESTLPDKARGGMHAATAGEHTADEGEGEGGPIVLYSPRCDDDESQCDGDSVYHVQHDEAEYVSYQQQQQRYSAQQQQQQQQQQYQQQQHYDVYCDSLHDSAQQQQHVDSFNFVYSGQQGLPWEGGSVAGSATDRQQQQCWDNDAVDDGDSIAVDNDIDACDSVSSSSNNSAAADCAHTAQQQLLHAAVSSSGNQIQQLCIDVDSEEISSQQQCQQQLFAEPSTSTPKGKHLSSIGHRVAYDAPRSPIG
jgi:hypothetical protein